jgi:RNA polymerase sigma-70 factor (ECF subfamily)
MQILAEDVELWADGGGKVRGAASRVLRGRETVAQFVHAIARRADRQQRVEIADLNGAPALIVRDGAEARITISLEVDQGRIQAIHVIGNPDKLRDLNRMLQNPRPDANADDYRVGDIIS